MKKLIALVVACLSLAGYAQETYSKVKIYADDQDLLEIYNLGIAIDHGNHKANSWFVTDLSSSDIQKLEDNGYVYEVIIKDVSNYYAARAGSNLDGANDRTVCPGSASSGYDIQTPSNFNLGSMGGYYTYQEFLDDLDLMRTTYPSLISIKTPISPDTLSWEGRPLYWVRISDNPDTDETTEPEVLYTALHHAREPLSLSQLMYYMWYLLENYGTNDEVTFLVDNTEMYFVPMINPDGYVYNETTNPGGGGMHRKNRNPSVGTSNKGVDLNRNYSYHWNESGTSTNQNDDTYAGSNAFSEPEIQCMNTFITNHDFKFAFNNHTYGDELLHPIGWANAEFAPDHNYFQAYSGHMAMYNGWAHIKSSDLYPAAGDSDDWAYIDDIATKDTVFAMTPEIGDDFWPPSSAIEATCKEMMFPNLVMANLPHVYGATVDLEPNQIASTSGYFNYSLQRLGLTNGDITISITPLTGIQTVGGSNVHSLSIMDLVEDSISFVLNPGIAFGDEIKYILQTDNGSWIRNDTITKSFGMGTPVFTDDCSDLTNWTGSWDFTNEAYVSASNSITDSPFTNYSNNADEDIQLNQSFDLSAATYAYVQFYAKWEIENNYDYVEFLISTDGGANWTPLCGNYTNMGTSDQDLDEPLYDGFQTDWVQEQVDLTDYLGNSNCMFKFNLKSDIFVREDGFYFDDFQVIYGTITGVEENQNQELSIYPNPVNNILTIQVSDFTGIKEIVILNDLGQPVITKSPSSDKTKIDVSGLSEGVYFVQVLSSSNEVTTQRFTVLK